MDDDRLLVDWIRHYASLVALLTILGGGAALALLIVNPPKHEAWTTVARQGFRISDRELGLMAQAVFRSEGVYVPGMLAAGVPSDPERFLEEHADIRPVPDTPVLTVVGRHEDLDVAEDISAALAGGLIRTFSERNLATLILVGETVPGSTALSGPVTIALGTVVGFWTALGLAVLHYRVRRPLLSLQRALRIVPADDVVLVGGRGPRWLGVLRPRPRWRNERRARKALEPVKNRSGPVVVAGGDERQEERIGRFLAPFDETGPIPAAPPLVVAHAGTGEVGLRAARAETESLADGTVDLLWVA